MSLNFILNKVLLEPVSIKIESLVQSIDSTEKTGSANVAQYIPSFENDIRKLSRRVSGTLKLFPLTSFIPLKSTLSSVGGKVIPYAFVVYAWGQTTISIFSDDPVQRAEDRGYKLK